MNRFARWSAQAREAQHPRAASVAQPRVEPKAGFIAEDVGTFFTAVSGVAAAVTVGFSWFANREQRYVRRAERASQRFERFVLDPIHKELPRFVAAVTALLGDGGKQLELFRQGDPKHQEVLAQVDQLAEQFNGLYYAFKELVETVVGTWPDPALPAQIAEAVFAIQDEILRDLATCAAAEMKLTPPPRVQSLCTALMQRLLVYDRDSHSGDPPPRRWFGRKKAVAGQA